MKRPNRKINCVLFKQAYPQGTDPFNKIGDQLHYTSDQEQLVLNNWDPYFHFLPKNIRSAVEHITNNSKIRIKETNNIKAIMRVKYKPWLTHTGCGEKETMRIFEVPSGELSSTTKISNCFS